mmetsp:Transcript_24404/g.73045  ORF Transcript_24404/g.73045 Transcript_24404/m.73045 type:complete len:1576 (-) Transcript_24404:1778-6505(-)
MATDHPLRVLLIDNFDSYAFNLYQRIAAAKLVQPPELGPEAPSHDDAPDGRRGVPGDAVAPPASRSVAVECEVIRNTDVPVPPPGAPEGASAEAWAALCEQYDCVVLSPGPGLPTRRGDFGGCAWVIERCGSHQGLPLLGVCLGHQGIAAAFGGSVVHSPVVAHGVLSRIEHDAEDELFHGVPRAFDAVRYHSWVVELPTEAGVIEQPDLRTIASTTDSGVELIMAIRHTSRPIWGVQFHPESVCTQYGDAILHNFLGAALTRRGVASGEVRAPAAAAAPLPQVPRCVSALPPVQKRPKFAAIELVYDWTDVPADAGSLIYNELYETQPYSFWLDSSKQAGVDDVGGDFSYLGCVQKECADTLAPWSYAVTYDSASRVLRTIRLVNKEEGGTGEVETSSSLDPAVHSTLFDWLQAVLDKRCMSPRMADVSFARCLSGKDPGYPFAFCGGFVGYFGYEMRRECGSECGVTSRQPDASFVYTERFVALDHARGRAYAVALSDSEVPSKDVRAWISSTLARVSDATRDDRVHAVNLNATHPPAPACGPSPFLLRHSNKAYAAKIEECLMKIREGEAYELCLTNEITSHLPASASAVAIYEIYRKQNPAPYGALLRFGQLWVLQSSPERFVRVTCDGAVQAKPIKGTAPRGLTEKDDRLLREGLSTSAKDFSENLMILDLIRNDLGQVCEIGSVTASSIMQVESYATVHQLVSTVEGQLRRDLRPCHLLHRAFPPGSMTGAPKLRSMEVLEVLEQGPRGVYSGTLGFLSIDGSCDMSVVIRTITIDAAEGHWSVGCGGAIVHGSHPHAEFEEMLLKARAPLRATATTLVGEPFLSTEGSAPDIRTDEVKHERGAFHLARGPDGAQLGRSAVGSVAAVAAVKMCASEQRLGKLGVRGMSLGLDRIIAVLDVLDNPHHSVKNVVHITGTNGKGSVSSYVAAALQGAVVKGGCRPVGLFTSPHLVRFAECIKVNGETISDAALADLVDTTIEASRSIRTKLTQFEVLTIAAFLHYSRCAVEFLVLEVGLGGRLDSTNVIPADSTLCSVVTSISLDHTKILGATRKEIAAEKSGIFRRGRPVVLAANISGDARDTLTNRAAALGCSVCTAGVAPYRVHHGVMVVAYRDFKDIRIPLRGRHQLENFGTAAEVLSTPVLRHAVGAASGLSPPELVEAFTWGLHSFCRWPARLQPLIYLRRLVLLDGSHNAEAATALANFVSSQCARLSAGWWPPPGRSSEESKTQVHWIVGMLSGKDHRGYMAALIQRDRGDTLTCVPVEPNVGWHSGEDPTVLASQAAPALLPPSRVRVAPSVEDALATVDASWGLSNTITVVCGSLHLCGQVLAHHEAIFEDTPPLQILETLRFSRLTNRVLFRDEHIARMGFTAARFGYSFDEQTFDDRVQSAILADCSACDLMIRCTLAADGAFAVATKPLSPCPPRPLFDVPAKAYDFDNRPVVRLSVSNEHVVHPLDPFSTYKTTRRETYTGTLAKRPHKEETSDVLLVNTRGEVTESTIYNVMVRLRGQALWVTPPVSSGLLAGCLRTHLVTSGTIVEGIVTVEALRRAEAVCVMNSVRGIFPATIVW